MTLILKDLYLSRPRQVQVKKYYGRQNNSPPPPKMSVFQSRNLESHFADVINVAGCQKGGLS